MNKEEIICASCESESYVESDGEIYFCPHCGSDVSHDDWEEEDPEEEEDN